MRNTENIKRQFLNDLWDKLERFFVKRGYAGEEIRRAFTGLYTMYRPELPAWLAGLYDSKIGGFYYSVSARDNEPFLPDIESTKQAINLMVNTGMISSPRDLPEAMQKKISEFARGMLDENDGYFYHRQWGKNIVDSRRSRDLTWALGIANDFGFTYQYPTATERLAVAKISGKSRKELPAYFASEESFLRYLESFDWENNSYYSGNAIAAQGEEIMTAGYAQLCAEFLNKYQNPENGFWSKLSDMHTGINGFVKISILYRNAGISIKMPEVAARSVMRCMVSDEIGTTVCHLYNVWGAMDNILTSLRASDEERDRLAADEIYGRLLKMAPEAIARAKYKTEGFMKPDGAFSFMRDRSTHRSQEAPVSVEGVLESDVNASVLCTSGLVNNIVRALGCEEVKVPLYTRFDYNRFLFSLK